MKRQFVVLFTATTSLVVLAFLVPLGVLLFTLAEDRAVALAMQDAQNVAVVVAVVRDPAQLEPVVTLVDQRSERALTVFLPDGRSVGAAASAQTREQALSGNGRAHHVDVAEGREVFVPVVTADGSAVVRALVPTELLRRGVVRALTILVVLGVVLLAAAVAVADRLARGVVRPVITLARTADQLASGDLTVRVTPSGPPEVRDVGSALNELAGRIAELLEAEHSHGADLSHRLRTPLTALRLNVEGLHSKRDARRLSHDVAEVERVIDDIIAAARRPMHEASLTSCDAEQVLAQRTAFWQVLAEDQGRPWRVETSGGPQPVRLREDDLAAALDALLGNVFAHTPEQTPVHVEVGRCDDCVCIGVTDQGPGLPADAVVRGHSSAGSTGLGLDIARRTAEVAGGSLLLEQPDGGGTRVVLLLPLSPDPPAELA